MKRTPLKNNGKGLKTNKPLQSKGSGLKQSSSLTSRKRMNVKSQKQKSIESDYNKMKRENFKADQLCTGCKNSNQSTPSHLIPRNRRRDLVAEKRNVKPHCLTCHRMWEGPDRVNLLDYEENMQIVKELDYEYYQILKRDES
jgi:hypothetical protein